MHLPPLFDSRTSGMQVLLGIVVPSIFGLITGLVLNASEAIYLVLSVLGIAGGFFAGIEHRGGEQGALRGVVGGLLFGTFILLGDQIAGADPKAHLPEPHVLLIVITTVFGVALGALGGRWRAKREPGTADPAGPEGSAAAG